MTRVPWKISSLMIQHTRRAFTLLELLLATVIVTVLAYFCLAGFSRLIEANALGTSAQMIRDSLIEARQDAVAQNITVEVRVYADSTGNGFNALQLHARNTDGTTPALSLPVLLSVGTVIDATAAHSSLVTTGSSLPADSTDPRLNAQTRCFHFLPSGATDLAPPGPWTLTVRGAGSSNPARFPSNWACITLDAATGRAQIYRP